MQKLIIAIENRDEDEINLENNLEGEVNQEHEQSLTADEEISQRQAFVMLFEKQIQRILERKM